MAQRERRSNAGNRMAKLLDEEEDVDDFYTTTYGGFNEAEEDNDYQYVYRTIYNYILPLVSEKLSGFCLNNHFNYNTGYRSCYIRQAGNLDTCLFTSFWP